MPPVGELETDDQAGSSAAEGASDLPGNDQEQENQEETQEDGSEASEEQQDQPDQGQDAQEEGDQEGDTEEGGEGDEDGEKPKENLIPESRFKEVVKAKNDFSEKVGSLEQEVTRLKEIETEHRRLKEELTDLQKIAEFDPRIKELMNHWFFKGGAPASDDIEDMGKFQEFLSERARREAERDAETKQREQRFKETTEEKFAALEQEEKEITKDPIFSELLKDDPNAMADAYDLLTQVFKAAQQTGDEPKVQTLQDALRFVRSQEVIDLTAKTRHKKSLEKATKGRKVLKQGGTQKAPPRPKVNPADLPVHEHVRAELEALSA